jgi:hypothetical protein
VSDTLAWATLAAAIVLAAITPYYAVQTHGMLDEMRLAREHASAPHVVAYGQRGVDGPEIHVTNYGGGPAFDVTVEVKSDRLRFDLADGDAIPRGSNVFEGLFLAPTQTIGRMAVITTMGSNPGDYPPAEVENRWKDRSGREYRERSVIAMGALLYATSPGSLAGIEHELREARRELRR